MFLKINKKFEEKKLNKVWINWN